VNALRYKIYCGGNAERQKVYNGSSGATMKQEERGGGVGAGGGGGNERKHIFKKEKECMVQ
jgi:hypothetical protein